MHGCSILRRSVPKAFCPCEEKQFSGEAAAAPPFAGKCVPSESGLAKTFLQPERAKYRQLRREPPDSSRFGPCARSRQGKLRTSFEVGTRHFLQQC